MKSLFKNAAWFACVGIILWVVLAFGRLVCKKPVPIVVPAVPAAETTHTVTPIVGSKEGHTRIAIPVHRPKVDTVLPPGLKPRPDDTVFVDIDQDVPGRIVVTPESLIGWVQIRRTKSPLIRIKPSLSLYAGFNGGVTGGLAADMIEVWKFGAGVNVGVRNIKPVGIDAGAHVVFNVNRNIGVLVGRTWNVLDTVVNPKWMVGVSVKLIGG